MNILQMGRSTNYLLVKQGTQGNTWKQAQVQLPSQTSTYQVVIQGLTGANYLSDIAIDDIRMITGTCSSSGVYNIRGNQKKIVFFYQKLIDHW